MNDRAMVELAIMLAPNPSEADIEHACKMDKMRNPHNESHKPPLRDRAEIILDYKIEMWKMLQVKIDRGLR